MFDKIDAENDFIMAFFPCIEFSAVAQMWYSLNARDYTKWSYKERIDYMCNKNKNRARMYELLIKFCGVCLEREIRMAFENPYALNTYLKTSVFLKEPSVVDTDRTRRGDFMVKPTAYWFFNCKPSHGRSFQQTPKHLIKNPMNMKSAPRAGLCSEERSMISPDYARNFICDFLLGKEQPYSERSLFPE